MIEETFPFLDEDGVAKVYKSVIDLVSHQSVSNFCKKSGKKTLSRQIEVKRLQQRCTVVFFKKLRFPYDLHFLNFRTLFLRWFMIFGQYSVIITLQVIKNIDFSDNYLLI